MDVSQLAHISHLNRAQKRALILRDQLKYRDQRHLDTFLIGVVHPEPPVYQRVNGKVHPPLTEVSLKEGATKFDLGNVKFDEGKTIFRVHLTIEGGHCEMRESEALPLDEDNLDSIPIHQFIAKNMIPLFMVKYEAIHMRKRNINEARHFAYNALNLPKIRFSEGKVRCHNPVGKVDLTVTRRSANCVKWIRIGMDRLLLVCLSALRPRTSLTKYRQESKARYRRAGPQALS